MLTFASTFSEVGFSFEKYPSVVEFAFLFNANIPITNETKANKETNAIKMIRVWFRVEAPYVGANLVPSIVYCGMQIEFDLET